MIARSKQCHHNRLCRTTAAVAIGLLWFVSINAGAQVSKIRTKDGAMISTTAPRASTSVPVAHAKVEESLPAGATVIYSNFGTGSSLYDAASGWTEAGAEANDYPLAEAMSFTPAGNYALLRIDMGITYLEGTNGVKLVLAKDDNGVPGKAIYQASINNLPAFGTCCEVTTAKINAKSKKILLASGQKYWLYPLPADTTTYLVWNLDTTNMGGDGGVSEDYGSTWTQTSLTPFGSFDIYGIKIGQ